MTDSPFREGEMLAGKYKVERMIAKGGMGVVVAAMHEALDQRVALKFLLPEGASNTDAVGRFLREARAAVRLRSEHVAKVLDVGTLDTGSPYIVMEYLEGRDLQAVLSEKGRLPAHIAVSYVLQACEAIAEAHAHGIVHRDLKPGNLFLTRRNDGTPCIKVLDFGISKLASGELASGMTKTSTLMGTPYYISPEQLRSSKLADCRSDIWALGMILYELLTGSVAFPRDTLPELCTAIIYDPPPELSSHGVEIAPQLVGVVMRCLAKSPDDRFQTLAELAGALSMFVVNGDASAERISRILDPKAQSPSIQPPPGAGPGAATVASAFDKPAQSVLERPTRREGLPSFEESASRTAVSAVTPRPARGLWVAGALGAALAVFAALWMASGASSSDARKATPLEAPARAAATADVAPPAPPLEAPIAAEPARPAAEPAEVAPQVTQPPGPAVAPRAGAAARGGAPVTRPRPSSPARTEGDDFGARK